MKLAKPTRQSVSAFFQKPLIQVFAIAAALHLLVDSFSRESFFRAFGAVFTSPFVFLYNTLIIAITLAPALFFARRILFYVIVSLLWVIIGVTDFILLQFRTTPFTFVDVTMIQSAIGIWDHYLSVWQLVLIALLLLAAIVGCVILFRKVKKLPKPPALRVVKRIILMLACAIIATDAGVWLKLLSKNFGNLADAYHKYGLPYCFANSLFNTGIDKPKKYSDEYVQQIIEAIENGTLVNSSKAEPGSAPTPVSGAGTPPAAITPAAGNSPTADTTLTPGTSPAADTSLTSGNSPATDAALAPGTSPAVDTTLTPGNSPAADTTLTPGTSPAADASLTTTPVPAGDAATQQKTPNILFLQLESFFDPTSIVGSVFTEDPLPNYRRLMENYTSGYLYVPSVGAGTANTEFEVITGMNLDFFGPGEYPYKTILLETTCESIGYVLKNRGYGTHAIHNNDGTFYGRHLVFPNLGFDSFTSIEYMNNVARTPLNWAKDEVLIAEIAKALDATKEPDFIYTISVQGHGSYPDKEILNTPAIDLTLPEHLAELYYPLLYYTNQIHEMDQFVADLIESLESRGEDTVLVMYGDHLPGFKLTEEDLGGTSLFATQYIVWSNFELEAEHPDLEAYQLYSYVLGRLGIHDGIINGFHRTQKGSELYLEELEILEYDMLYGDQTCYNGTNPYAPTDMQMGLDPIFLTGIRALGTDAENALAETTVFFLGFGFTPYSYVQADGKELDTMFVSDTVLTAVMPLPGIGTEITVVQHGPDEQVLSRCEPLIITEGLLRNIFPEENPELEGED